MAGVPIFKSGDVAVIHHTTDELLPDSLTAGQVVTLARGDLAFVMVTDQRRHPRCAGNSLHS